MIEYLIIFILFFILAVNNGKIKNTWKNVWLSVIFVYLTLLFGLRYRVGIDTLNYMKLNDILPRLSEINMVNFFALGLEPFYVLLSAICKEISDEFFILQLVHAFILNYCVIYFFRKHCKNPFSALLVYAFVYALYFSTEIVREGLAISIFLLNFDNLLKHNWKRYYLLAICSIMFHMSALIILLFPFCMKLRYNNKLFIIILLFSLILVPSVQYLAHFFTADIFAGRVDKYLNLADSDRLNFNWVIFAFARLVLLPFLVLYISRRAKYQDKLEPMVCLSIVFGVGSLLLEVFFSRFTNYTSIFLCAYISNMFYASKVAKQYSLIIVFYLTIVCGKYYQEKYVRWFPYHSIINPIEERDRELLWTASFNH